MKTTTKKRKTKRSFFIGNRFKKTVVSRFKQIIFSKCATKVNPVLKIYETVYKQAESMCLILVENLQLKLINFRVHTY